MQLERPARPLRIPDFPMIHGLGWLAFLVVIHGGFALAGGLLFWAGLRYSWDALSMWSFASDTLYCLTILAWAGLTLARMAHPERPHRTEQSPPFEELPWSRR